MTSFAELFFSPVSREYCNWFYFLTVAAFIFMVLAGFCTLNLVLKGSIDALQGLLIFASPFLSYFTNRLLYSMCANSLHPTNAPAPTHVAAPGPTHSQAEGPQRFGGYTTFQ